MLKEKIIKEDYPSGGWIVTFGDEPYIRDGLHRASILYYLKGDLEIAVLNVVFKPLFSEWGMVKKNNFLSWFGF